MTFIDPELKLLADGGRFDEFEELWLARIDESPTDHDFFVGGTQVMLRAGEETRATMLLQLLLEAHREQGDARAELDLLKPALRLWPQSPVLRPALLDCLQRVYADRPSLENLALHFRLAEAADPIAALAAMETWLHFDVGRSVLLQGRGMGRVREINLALGTLRVEFGETRLSLRLGEAQKLLVALEPGHFLLEKLEKPQDLAALAESDPSAILEKVFSSFDRGLAVAELRELFSGVVPAANWNSWWKRARANPRLSSTSGSRPVFSWSRSGAEADASLLGSFQAASPREQIDMARKHAARSPKLAALFVRGVARIVRESRAEDPGLALEAALALEKLPEAADADPGIDAGQLLDLHDPVPTIAEVADRGLRERALALLRERRENWAEFYARLLRAENDTRTLGTLYDALAEEPAVRNRAVDEVLSRPQIAPRLFVWLCREMRRRPELESRADWGLLRRLLDAHTEEAFRSLRVPLRELFDAGGLGGLLAQRLTLEQAEQLLAILTRELGLEEHRKDLLRRIVLERFPELREAEEEVLYTTPEALERKRAEFEQITRFDIPRNAEEIRKAAAHGDLRENSEYKAAREKHEMLSSRAKTMHDELRRSRTIDPGNLDISRVRVGTRLRLEPTSGGRARELTILGPWDSDPGNGIVSYLAPAVQALLGLGLGDCIRFQDAEYRIAEIASWRQE